MADENNENSSKIDAGECSMHRNDNKKKSSQARHGKGSFSRVRKRKRRFDPTEKLPTPPPDPRDTEKSTGERSPKRKSLEDDKENGAREEDPRGVGANVSSPAAQAYAAAFSGTEEAFRHLDKLHFLMEQILELREKNAKLFRRVRELERFKALRRLDSSSRKIFLQADFEPFLPDDNVGFAEPLLSAILESSNSSSGNQTSGVSSTPNPDLSPRAKSFRAPITRQRSRSISTDTRPVLLPGNSKRSSCHLQYGGSGSFAGASPLAKSAKRNFAGTLGLAPPKVSKWTKVKAAFKWEKAGMGNGSGALGNIVVEAMDHDATRYLRPPEGSDLTTSTNTPSGSSPRTAEHSGPPSPGTISSSSSTDDVYNGLHKRIHAARSITRELEEDPTRRSRSLDGEFIIPQNHQCATQHLRDGISRRLEKGHKTPWGMVKDIIQARRESVRRSQPRCSIRSEDGYSLSSLESSDMLHDVFVSELGTKPRVQITTSEGSLTMTSSKPSSPANSSEIVDLASRRLTPTLTITVPSNEELRSVSSPESVSPPVSHHQLDSNSTDERSEDPDSTSSPQCRSSVVSPSRERRRSAATSAIQVEKHAGTPKLQRHDSKWNKVKWAFLTSASSVPPSPSRMSSSFFDETDGGGSYSASAEDLENNDGISPTTQTDIQRNYQLLNEKLSVEFYRKLTEWEKLKSSQSTELRQSSRNPASPKDKDSANALIMGEEQLTPEFKKKLQEWKRIKKGNSSGTTSPEHQLFRRRLTDWQIWRTSTKNQEGKSPVVDGDSGKPHLSEDFLKKMEEWKKIKSARSDEEQSTGGRRDSAETICQMLNADQRWKAMDDKEFQPLNKVIEMIEREQQRVEKCRDKLLDKKSKMNELNQVLDSTPVKRDVLVQTSSGFYRFEGISQEFTRKLYEWEKSQGIAPEYSTFQLLNPAYKIFAADKNIELNHRKDARLLKRSKSMSSVVNENNLRDDKNRQPSSLSLNDVGKIENDVKERIDSKQTIGEEEMSEELALDDSEPEAVIVDIEDVIEETASPMAKFQPQQTPVYCVTASETTSIAIPLGTVTASHEPSPVILIQPGETYHRVRKSSRFSQHYDENINIDNSFKIQHDNAQSRSQINISESGDYSSDDNRKRIFEPCDINICETIIEEEIPPPHIGEKYNVDKNILNIEKSQDNKELETLEETKFHKKASTFAASNNKNHQTDKVSVKNSVSEAVTNTANYSESSCNATKKVFKTLLTQSSDATEEDSCENSKRTDAAKSDDYASRNFLPKEDPKNTDVEDSVITVSRNIRQKKVLKTRRLTDTQIGYKWRQSSQTVEESSPEPVDALTVSTFSETPSVERIIINEATLNKIVVPTASNEQISNISTSNDKQTSHGNENFTDEDESYCRRLGNKSESNSVFVKTKRIIFSPFSRRNSKEKTISSSSSSSKPKEEEEEEEVETIEGIKETPIESIPVSSKSVSPRADTSKKCSNIHRSKSSTECPVSNEKRPPLPQSPVLARKEYRRSSPKETAPSIRIMIQRYNQKLQEDAGSPASSGSGSPIWRSPTSERRVRTQMEKYQEEVRRAITGSANGNFATMDKGLEKSASASILRPSLNCRGKNLKGEILKSTSADFVRNPDFAKGALKNPSIDDSNNDKEFFKNDEDKILLLDKRKNSLQNKNPEIFSNIKQYLVQENATLSIKNEKIKDANNTNTEKSKCIKEEKNFNLRPEKDEKANNQESTIAEKLSPELINKLNALSSATNDKRYSKNIDKYDNHVPASENSTPLRVRAQRIKKAKDDFFSRGPSCYSYDPSIESYRQSQNSNTSIDLSSKNDFVKSASAGMINVDTRTFERLATARATESLPCAEKINVEVTGTLSKIASKFRRTKLRKGKDKETKMSTVSMLCRQSLLVDIQQEEMMSKSCPTTPSPQRDEDDRSRVEHYRDSN